MKRSICFNCASRCSSSFLDSQIARCARSTNTAVSRRPRSGRASILLVILFVSCRRSGCAFKASADSAYDAAGNVVETHEHEGDFKEWLSWRFFWTKPVAISSFVRRAEIRYDQETVQLRTGEWR